MILAESSIETNPEANETFENSQYYNLKSEDSLMEPTINSDVDNQ